MSHPETLELLFPEEPVVEGEIILYGPSGALALEVIAVRGDKAWVREVDDGRHGVIDVASLRMDHFGASGMLQ
ncbi:MAG TPA: hypothetical protein VFH92_12955 [Phenylobacterium sp.]|nr:hypothetical protein [Phenylobacterium sp.]